MQAWSYHEQHSLGSAHWSLISGPRSFPWGSGGTPWPLVPGSLWWVCTSGSRRGVPLPPRPAPGHRGVPCPSWKEPGTRDQGVPHSTSPHQAQDTARAVCLFAFSRRTSLSDVRSLNPPSFTKIICLDVMVMPVCKFAYLVCVNIKEVHDRFICDETVRCLCVNCR